MPSYALRRLEWSVRALHQPAGIQGELFPAFVAVADELALDFDHWLAVAEGHSTFGPTQHSALQALSRKLDDMSGDDHQILWSLEALVAAPEWLAIRQLAGAVLEAFGWSAAPPPPSPDAFVQSRSDA